MSSESAALVASLEICGLFGHKDLYIDLTGDAPAESQGRRLSLLYGNNGSGKTTALRLLWHALSPDNIVGHRTKIAYTPFDTFTIKLCGGDVIRFTKHSGAVGSFSVTVSNSDGKLLEQAYEEVGDGRVQALSLARPLEDRSQDSLFELEDEASHVMRTFGSVRIQREPRRRREDTADLYAKYLRGLGSGPYLLADDRKIYGDGIEESRPSRNRRVHVIEDQDPAAIYGVPAELNTALLRVYEAIQKMVFNGNVSGSRDSNNVYLGILQKISRTNATEADSTTRERLRARLESVAMKTRDYSVYGLMPPIRKDSFSEVLDRTPDNKFGVAEDVMQPFLEAQEARLDALSGVARLLSTLTKEINRFFSSSGKAASYKAQQGLRVLSEEGDQLQPEDLSSGERQILLLLLNTVLARESTPLFLIDEPELSLNVKWQRQLVSALLALTEGSPVQFIIATHSIEVLTGHRESLATVRPVSTKGQH
ncbi:AAA family ATPase [Streptomyces sp. NPDC057680]|uniref:AAA family ATPase n=1 Tax=Streptomyces sp. NPDC057680 TaxID=3346208 RepID=UPI0036BB707E